MAPLVTIPARRGKAAHVAAGQRIRVVNTHGTQVVDTWSFSARDATEWMSMEASRAWFLKLAAAVGDSFVTNRRRPILTLVEDTSGGVHDTLIAPCDPHRYHLLGVDGYHDNCRDNLHAALAELQIGIPATPPALNLFMNIPWTPDGRLSWGEPVSRARQSRSLPGGDGPRDRLLRVPPGHPPDQRPVRAHHRSPFRHRIALWRNGMRTPALVRVAVVVIAWQAAPVSAAPQGPFCFSNLPFTDQFSLFFDAAGSSFAGYGQNLLTGAPATSYGFVTGGTATITITSSLPATGEGHAFSSTAQLNLGTGQGPGRCEAVNTLSGCGPGSAITLALVTCPATSGSVERVEPPLAPDPSKPGPGGGPQ